MIELESWPPGVRTLLKDIPRANDEIQSEWSKEQWKLYAKTLEIKGEHIIDNLKRRISELEEELYKSRLSSLRSPGKKQNLKNQKDLNRGVLLRDILNSTPLKKKRGRTPSKNNLNQDFAGYALYRKELDPQKTDEQIIKEICRNEGFSLYRNPDINIGTIKTMMSKIRNNKLKSDT